jgi:AIPR protein
VVTGCQTSHCLYLSRESLGDAVSSVHVPLKLVVTSDEDVATRIIEATNSQTEVQENDLVALTKFQKRLEDFYKLDPPDVKLTYERRSGQFYGKNVTKTRVVTINGQMRAVSAVFLDIPHTAARYPNTLYNQVGNAIFRDDHKFLPYLAGAFAAYRIENAFRTGLDPFYKPARYHILMACKYQILGTSSTPLNSVKCEQQSEEIITTLKKPDQVGLFQAAAETVVNAGGGLLPSPDRLKRQQFTQELISVLT